ncbi:aa3-type cytochrome c oxidase subunit IV [Propylenella binzhouense]|uniref:Aa3-type cytochrome c oxidase subunit IV n=1 Tax=Propylenella binzhouense TaxID=2555902 RepID=A0A964T856_9HYPH|nr:aa3-type cytochrome c oxidase subunit IV [Propylenella binzhouense]MYZ49544.1 aa3-type cytochrome c oxidase subunit IV [Propylenella binzhouense]
MAEHVSHGPAELGAEMDYREHERTYEAFIKGSQVLALATFDIVIALVLFAFGGGAGFWLGSLLVLLTLVATAIGFAMSESWKAPGIVFAIGVLFMILSVA